MSTFWKTTLAFMIFAGFGACSQVQFGKISNCQNSGYPCQLVCDANNNCIEAFSNFISVPLPQVDVLFVIDNSGSMSFEQQDLANRFSSFFDKIKGMDYHLAITTTDVSASEPDLLGAGYGPSQMPYSTAPNWVIPKEARLFGSGSYQDGKFIKFHVGNSEVAFLQKDLNGNLPTDSENEAAFLATLDQIQQQTEYCESTGPGFLEGNCASGDERGIYALNLALDNNSGNDSLVNNKEFFRKMAHLAVIIVSDGDERSRTKSVGGQVIPDNFGYPSLNYFAPQDQPEEFINKLKSRFSVAKTLGVHSIVVKDSTCANTQKNQYGGGAEGSIGHQYIRFSNMTNGNVGSVCASDYGPQLGQIGSTILEQRKYVALACRPVADYLEVEFIDPPMPNVTWTLEAEKARVKFDPALPPGTKIKLHYDCNL